jgi:sterol 24-C-methyltransferase
MKTLRPTSLLYRLPTILHSLKALYRLSPKQVDNFLNSYEIYHCDWINGQAVVDSKVVEYKDVKESILNYYGVLNHLCAIGAVEKMYIPPFIDVTKGVMENQVLFERRFCEQLGIKQGDKVLELGCGKGRVAAHLASLTKASITAINIDQGQLDSAKKFTKKNHLSQLCHFMNADFNDLPLPFADHSFDSLYEIQALSLSKDLKKLFQEMHRVLKPGGKISFLEWVRMPNYNPSDPHHADLMKRVKPLIGAIGTPSPEEYESLLQEAGFDVLISEEPSVNKGQGPLINKAGDDYNTIARVLNLGVKIKLFPKYFTILFDRLRQDGQAFRQAERLGLVTTSYHLVAQKRK